MMNEALIGSYFKIFAVFAILSVRFNWFTELFFNIKSS